MKCNILAVCGCHWAMQSPTTKCRGILFSLIINMFRLTNRLLLLFRTVLALPKASNNGLLFKMMSLTCCTLVPPPETCKQKWITLKRFPKSFSLRIKEAKGFFLRVSNPHKSIKMRGWRCAPSNLKTYQGVREGWWTFHTSLASERAGYHSTSGQ